MSDQPPAPRLEAPDAAVEASKPARQAQPLPQTAAPHEPTTPHPLTAMHHAEALQHADEEAERLKAYLTGPTAFCA